MQQKVPHSIQLLKYILLTSILICFCSNTPIFHSSTKAIFTSDCTKIETNSISSVNDFSFRYHLKKPSKTCILPKTLKEISALSFSLSTQNLISVNDEYPIIYILDLEQCEIKKRYDFGKKGDYEGIEINDQMVYILKSNGHIYSFDLATEKARDTYKTPSSQKNDLEGIAFDPNQNELILACKAASKIKKPKQSKHTKSFYAFDLNKKKLKKTPKFSITDKALLQFFKKSPYQKGSKKSRRKFLRRLKSFSPSAIALHPIDGHFYILSSVGKTLIVASPSGKIKAVQFLNSNLYSQPEGICFSPQGKMFISNEGRSDLANILSFEYQEFHE